MPTIERFDADTLRATVVTYRDLMHAHAERINRLNVYPVPDGDTGTNMTRTLDAVVAELDAAPADLTSTSDAISHGSLMGARGNSGVILSQILRGLATSLKRSADGAPQRVADAFRAAAAAAYEAVLKPIEGTILTVAREAGDGACAAAASGASLVEVLRAARAAGHDALRRTPDLLPVLREAGVVDAGGAGFLLLVDSALHVVGGDDLPVPPSAELDGLAVPAGVAAAATLAEGAAHDAGETSVADLRYEVMYLLDLDDAKISEFKHAWGRIGGSIVVVGGEGLWNCHVHTNDIGAAVEAALDLGGRPRAIRVSDLFEEVAGEHALREATLAAAAVEAEDLAPVTCAVVAVSSGDGISTLFRQLGVQVVVAGGQTLNPSTAELLDAVERTNARQVIVLPNNKNIIPVAEQLDALTDKEVRVVRSASMPEALASLVLYDPEADIETNVADLSEAAASVYAGEVTQAVRDSTSEAGPIAEGDWLGIVRGDGIIAVDADLFGAVTALVDHILADGRELLTVVVGRDASGAHTDAIEAWLGEQHPDVQVEIHFGGQPLYPYLFGAE